MWKTVLLFIPLGLVLSCCAQAGVRGNGQRAVRALDLAPFNHVEAGSVLKLVIHAGEPARGEISGDANLVELVRVKQKGERLTFEVEKEVDTKLPLQVELWIPDLRSLDLSGASSCEALELDQPKLRLNASGASRVVLAGQVGVLICDLSGASRLIARACQAARAEVELSGASKGEISVQEVLSMSCSGASHLEYWGRPTLDRMDTSGAASIKSHDVD
jgi:hypothetical protein